jgi:hypothetical protein
MVDGGSNPWRYERAVDLGYSTAVRDDLPHICVRNCGTPNIIEVFTGGRDPGRPFLLSAYQPKPAYAHEVGNIRDTVLAPQYRHRPVSTLAVYAQRIGKVFASPSTRGKLIRERGWLRPRQRIHPAKPTVGVRAAKPNGVWHVDTTILKLLDGTKAYLRAVIDRVVEEVTPGNVKLLLPPRQSRVISFGGAQSVRVAAITTCVTPVVLLRGMASNVKDCP